MKRWSILLGICLAIQVVLAVWVNLARTDYSTFKPMEKLLPLDVKTVDGIRIEQNDDHQVVLKKKQGKWRIVQLNNFQADQDRIEKLLGKLADLKKGWPVTTTAAAAKRLKVAENNCERKIILSRAGQDIGTLYIGTSPSFRKVHARRKDETAVYAVNFNDYDAGAEPEDWIDKGILKHQAAEISKVTFSDYSVSRQEGKLVVEGIDRQVEKTDQQAAERLFRRIADLHIRTVLGSEAKPEYNQEHPVFSYRLALSSGGVEKYVFSKPKDANYYVLKPSHRRQYFKVDTWVADDIKKIDRSELVKKKDDKKAAAQKDEGSTTIKSSHSS